MSLTKGDRILSKGQFSPSNISAALEKQIQAHHFINFQLRPELSSELSGLKDQNTKEASWTSVDNGGLGKKREKRGDFQGDWSYHVGGKP